MRNCKSTYASIRMHLKSSDLHDKYYSRKIDALELGWWQVVESELPDGQVLVAIWLSIVNADSQLFGRTDRRKILDLGYKYLCALNGVLYGNEIQWPTVLCRILHLVHSSWRIR